jgi:hypothetical protein
MKSVNANKINRKSGEAEGSAVRPGWLPKLRVLMRTFQPRRGEALPFIDKDGEAKELKVELQRSLQNTWSRRVDGVAEGRAANIAVDCGGAVKLRVIENVKCFYPEEQGF